MLNSDCGAYNGSGDAAAADDAAAASGVHQLVLSSGSQVGRSVLHAALLPWALTTRALGSGAAKLAIGSPGNNEIGHP